LKRFLAIAVIWLGCLAAWMILGSTLHVRSDSLTGSLRDGVHTLWGPPGRQAPPLATYKKKEIKEEVVIEQKTEGTSKKTVQHETWVDVPIALDASTVDVKLELQQQRKGLMWFPTYGVDFKARYTFLNDSAEAQEVTVRFPLRTSGEGAATSASFDGFAVVDAQGKPVDFRITGEDAVFAQRLEPGERRHYGMSYRTRGTASFRYLMAQGTGRVHDLTVNITTNFPNVDFPVDTLSPTSRKVTDDAFHGQWRFASLVSTSSVGIDLPQLLNPGPLAAKVTFFAPLSRGWFFLLVARVCPVRGPVLQQHQ
jgi:hypothetical protein